MGKNKTKFSKGPWRAGKNPYMTTVLSGQEGKAIYPEDGSHHIAWANAYTEEGKIDMVTALANAALIAAAPDMYRLLSMYLKEAIRAVNYNYHRWIRSGLKRESWLSEPETEKVRSMVRETRNLLKKIRKGGME